MSKLPKILGHNNSEGFKSTFANAQDSYSNDTYNKITQSDFPFIQKANGQQGPKINTIVVENKLSEIESRFSLMEESSSILLNRLVAAERNFEIQLKEMQMRMADDREHRLKAEKALSILTDQSSLSANDLQMKLNLLQNLIEKEDKYKSEQRERDIEIYKNLINKLTEKVSETVKAEIQARFQADIDNKTTTNNVIAKFETEIDSLRREMADLANQNKMTLQQASRECSERTHNVSKYVDMQISDAVIGKGGSNDYLKNFVHKLTDQIKTNLISQNSQNDICNTRLTELETALPVNKDDFYKFVTQVEDRLIEKMKDVKGFSEANITKCHQELTALIGESAKNADSNIEFLNKQLMDTRNRINKQMILLDKASLGRFRSTCEDIQAIANRVYLYEDVMKQEYEQNKQLKESVTDQVNQLATKYDVNIVNERIIHSIENNILKEQIERCKVAILNMNNSISSDMGKVTQNSDVLSSGILKRVNYLQEVLNTLAEKNIVMFDEFQNSIDQIEIRNLMNEMLFKAENDNVLRLMQESKNIEHYLHLNINDHANDIIIIKEKLAKLFSTLDNSGANMANTTQDMKDILNAIKNNEPKIGSKVLDEIIAALDTYNENEGKILMDLHKIEGKMNTHEQMNEKEFDEVWKQLRKSKPKEESVAIYSPHNDNDESKIKITLDQVLNNVEFTNIYSILNELAVGKKPTDQQEEGKKMSSAENDIVDSKIAKLLEKIRNDNVNMWVHAVQLTQKVNQPNEIRKIIQSVPPVVYPLSETLKRILDVDYREGQEVKPYVPQLGNDIRKAEDYQRQKKDNDAYDKYMQNPDDDYKANKVSGELQNMPDNTSNKPASRDNPSNKGGSQNKNRGGKLKKDPNASNKDTTQFK